MECIAFSPGVTVPGANDQFHSPGMACSCPTALRECTVAHRLCRSSLSSVGVFAAILLWRQVFTPEPARYMPAWLGMRASMAPAGIKRLCAGMVRQACCLLMPLPAARAGIGISNDPVLQTRVMSYSDTQRYRLGGNYQLLPINMPKCPFHNNHKDGVMNYTVHDEEVGRLLQAPPSVLPVVCSTF